VAYSAAPDIRDLASDNDSPASPPGWRLSKEEQSRVIRLIHDSGEEYGHCWPIASIVVISPRDILCRKAWRIAVVLYFYRTIMCCLSLATYRRFGHRVYWISPWGDLTGPSCNFYREGECEIWPRSITQPTTLAFQPLSFRKVVGYLKSKIHLYESMIALCPHPIWWSSVHAPLSQP